jgi:hypothetical protein
MNVRTGPVSAAMLGLAIAVLCLLPCAGLTKVRHFCPQGETKDLAVLAAVAFGLAVLVAGRAWRCRMLSRASLVVVVIVMVVSAVGVTYWWIDALRDSYYYGCVFF